MRGGGYPDLGIQFIRPYTNDYIRSSAKHMRYMPKQTKQTMNEALLVIPNHCLLGPSNLSLQLQHAIQQCFSSWRAPWNVNVDRNDSITPTNDGIAIMIISTSVGATAHGNDPSRFWHLVVDFAKGRGHFVGEGACDNHDIRLARRGAENDAETIKIIACGTCRVVMNISVRRMGRK